MNDDRPFISMSRTPIADEDADDHVRRLIKQQFQTADIELEQMTYGHGSVPFSPTRHASASMTTTMIRIENPA